MRSNTYFVYLVFFILLITSSCGTNPEEKEEGKTVRVAMCQIFCLDGDRSGNLARIENAVREAVESGSDIACFPETSLLGWVNPDAHQRSFPIPGEDADRLCRIAEKYGIHLCIGLAEKEGDKLYDSVILIDDQGSLLLKHRKINILSELMDPPYTPGDEVNCVQTRFGKVGLLICADTFKEDILQRMTDLKPDLVIVPYGWAANEDQWPGHGEQLKETVIKAARTIGAPLVGVDLVGEITHGPWTGMTYGGLSVAVDAEGKVLAVAMDRDRDVVTVEISVFNQPD